MYTWHTGSAANDPPVSGGDIHLQLRLRWVPPRTGNRG